MQMLKTRLVQARGKGKKQISATKVVEQVQIEELGMRGTPSSKELRAAQASSSMVKLMEKGQVNSKHEVVGAILSLKSAKSNDTVKTVPKKENC